MKIAEQINTLICDDIREEIGNKTSYIGVYHDIIVEKIPLLLPKLSIAVRLNKVKKDISKFKLVIKLPDKDPIVHSREVGTVVKRNMNIHFALCPFPIDVTGSLVFEISFNDDEKPSIIHSAEIKITERK